MNELKRRMFDPAGKRVTVMGLGRFGGGVGVSRFLAARGAEVLVTDREPEERLARSVAQLRDLVDSGRVRLRLGGHTISDFTACDAVVANPAVPRPWEDPYLRAAHGAGVAITTEIGLLIERLPDRARTIGVTGSVGKSTTSAMIAHALAEVVGPGGVVLGGNIGGSLLERIDAEGPGALGPGTFVVLELSSFMLHWLGESGLDWSPRVAVVTNLAPNHLDWHGSVGHYAASKQNLVRAQRAGDEAILGESVADWERFTAARARVVRDGIDGPMALPGAHNRLNAAMALAAAGAALGGDSRDALARAVRSFRGLAHRLEMVAEHARVRYYNDSKSTTPEASETAVRAIASALDVGDPWGKIHLIAGGYDKGSDLSPIVMLGKRLAGVYTIGATGPGLATAIGEPAAWSCVTLREAVAKASRRLRPGDVLLLSPGCASWDQYENFEARGDEFVRLVRERIDAGTGVPARVGP
ncbi:MAG: UDP-N-acetylmuramoyl-L-alanine--D-glutamate ligase [Phycisphaerae bacterium]|nr:UDP-N-acetylmuramoyl-L-alanine--D-glutamate ligase [Phycisphaerae bacterium]